MASITIDPSLQKALAEHGQSHVLRFFDLLGDEEKKELLDQLHHVNLAQTNIDFKRAMETCTESKLDSLMKPLPSEMAAHAVASPPSDEMVRWQTLGLNLISQGKVACILLAGGQGTRLGSSLPKGMYDMQLPSGSTLFHVQGQRLHRLQQLAREQFGGQGSIVWYIMTSDSTQAPTMEFFARNDYFGLDRKNVVFFPQNCVPALDNDGKLILATKHSLALSPDGNGGLYSSLVSAGVLSDMQTRGIEHVHVYCVDNILVRVADPTFIGFCAEKKTPAGSVVVSKASPDEKVGVLCSVGGLFQVVEYSEIESATAQMRTSNGTLVYNAGNICNHYFTREFLNLCSAKSNQLKLHVAKKKIPTVDDQGNAFTPEKENGVKLEKFVFDVFAFTEHLAALEMPRQQIFSPLKNKDGACSAATCRSDLYALCRRFLHDAGAVFEDENGNEIPLEKMNESHVCEISPIVSYAGENLTEYVKAHPRLRFPVLIKSL